MWVTSQSPDLLTQEDLASRLITQGYRLIENNIPGFQWLLNIYFGSCEVALYKEAVDFID